MMKSVIGVWAISVAVSIFALAPIGCVDQAQNTEEEELVFDPSLCRPTLYSNTNENPGDTQQPGHPPQNQPTVDPDLSQEEQQELNSIQRTLEKTAELTTQEFIEQYHVDFYNNLPFDPLRAANLDLIQDSTLALDRDELDMLGHHGFIISERKEFESFTRAYETIYALDLPVYVTADSILHAIFRSFDSILEHLEMGVLIDVLREMLDTMRENLWMLDDRPEIQNDVSLYLNVALRLLDNSTNNSPYNHDSLEFQEILSLISQQIGEAHIELFGKMRQIDFSQFTPRGHYYGMPKLEGYFQAVIWLGRIDFRIIEYTPDGSPIFNRRQLEGALALHELNQDSAREQWQLIEGFLNGFIGHQDNMILPELDQLLAHLGVRQHSDLDAIADEDIVRAIIDGGFGTQDICGHLIASGAPGNPQPLPRTFLFLGHRYTFDSHVFSALVHDRVRGRLMPSSLDVAFAALGNDQAASLLEEELLDYNYAPELTSMRLLIDYRNERLSSDTMYNLWLDMLRTLSPPENLAEEQARGLPEVAMTEAWGRRLLSSQLGSWAELRHNTVAYVKQSYTANTCEYPDGYVDPYPEFFGAVVDLAHHTADLLSTFPEAGHMQVYLHDLQENISVLEEIALHQRDGFELTEHQLDFLNDAVRTETIGCGTESALGWYPKLYFNPDLSLDGLPAVVDVHTDPNQNQILHVGAGHPRLMIVTVETCQGPRAYAGPVTSFFEHISEDFNRLNDEEWLEMLDNSRPPDVPWMEDLVSRYPDCQ